jgi:cellulose synthase/poly-beta-1,6-N-acetylglucosamine synthase-like glycosyltransferase
MTWIINKHDSDRKYKLISLVAYFDYQVYDMEQPPNPTPKDSISALAFLVKNLVRPSGLKQLGFPSLLTGTGMAFPWSIIRSVSLASRNIVEDMQMSLELAIAGPPTVFCP